MTSPQFSTPAGLRLYAIGDIHGRLDLLEQLLEKITADCASLEQAEARLVFLGDYIDRGVYSRQVIDILLHLKATLRPAPVFLMGNHEQVMRTILLESDQVLLQDWMRFGGRETLLSYGIPPIGDPAAIIKLLQQKVPPAHLDFLTGLQVSAVLGDYFFCHAGVRPGVALDAQSEQDLVWIRHDFLTSQKPHGKMIVHGHTIAPQVEFRPNRVNVDTGAYATGCLTALALEGSKQWLLQTG
jgi:serine/threonine protein phosphatase 1